MSKSTTKLREKLKQMPLITTQVVAVIILWRGALHIISWMSLGAME